MPRGKTLADFADGTPVELTLTGSRGTVEGRSRGIVWIRMESEEGPRPGRTFEANGRTVQIKAKGPRTFRVPVFEAAPARRVR